jgi:hypothetical protein
MSVISLNDDPSQPKAVARYSIPQSHIDSSCGIVWVYGQNELPFKIEDVQCQHFSGKHAVIDDKNNNIYLLEFDIGIKNEWKRVEGIESAKVFIEYADMFLLYAVLDE